MTSTTIQFGTDGWRAIIGQDFIPENIEKVIQAFCDWRKRACPEQVEGACPERASAKLASRRVILGYDRRLKSKESAHRVAEVLAGNGMEVSLSSQFCPTPCVSWIVKNSDAFVGIMVTASHNPGEWNGIKFKEEYGGSASPEYTAQVEAQMADNETKKAKINKMPFEDGVKEGLISFFNPKKEYINQLKSLIDLDGIRKSGWRVLYDPMYGAGAGFLKEILGDQAHEINAGEDFKFGGKNPEPIEKNLGDFISKMKTGKFQVGLATDGDADRIGAVDENGNFISSHIIFALLLKHYVEDKKLKGTIVKSISTTRMINRLCQKYGLPLIETPVGFKYICAHLEKENALMGGEESGGISFAPHVHERDGLLNGLMLLEMASLRKKTLGQLVEDLFKELGPYYFNRIDMHVEQEKIKVLKEKLKSTTITHLAEGLEVASASAKDGFQYFLNDGSWLLIRASGTEPLVRIYAEAGSTEKVAKILEAGQKLINI